MSTATQFEFHYRRVNTEGAHRPAATRYDSAEANEEEEEMEMGGEFFDLNQLPDDKPPDLFSNQNQKATSSGRISKQQLF
jgi:hypothetical protein